MWGIHNLNSFSINHGETHHYLNEVNLHRRNFIGDHNVLVLYGAIIQSQLLKFLFKRPFYLLKLSEFKKQRDCKIVRKKKKKWSF